MIALCFDFALSHVGLSAPQKFWAERGLVFMRLSLALTPNSTFLESINFSNKVGNVTLEMSAVYSTDDNRFRLFLVRPDHSLPILAAIGGHKC